MVKIEIRKGIDPGLKRPVFLCDNRLKDDVPSPYNLLVDSYKFILWVGRPGSGKTSHLFSLFKDKRCLKKTWNNIILVMPIQSLKSMKGSSNIFKDISEEKLYDDLADIDIIREQVKQYADEGENSVIIIDDQMTKLKDPIIEKVLADIVANRRHYRTSIILLTQIYERVPLKLRKLANTVIMMYRPSKRELEMMFDELLEQDRETALEVNKIAFVSPYSWLMVDVPSQKLFAKYDEIIISDDWIK